MSDDDFVIFMNEKKFSLDETGYFYKKIGNSWVNCDTSVNLYTLDRTFEVKVVTSKGDDIYSEIYYDFDDFQSIISIVIREERLRILLDKDI